MTKSLYQFVPVSSAPALSARSTWKHIGIGRKTPLLFATAEDGHHEVKLCEAVLQSSRAKKWVKV